MERYDSAADFAADLRRLTRGEEPLALTHHSDIDPAAATEYLPQSPAAAASGPGQLPVPLPVWPLLLVLARQRTLVPATTPMKISQKPQHRRSRRKAQSR